MNILKKLFELRYNLEIISIISRLGLNKILRKIFNLIMSPLKGCIRITFHELTADFYCRNSKEFGLVAGSFWNIRENEAAILEKILEELRPGDTAYDIGAFIGTHAIFMAKKVGMNGSIIAFEPEESNFIILKKNIHLNRAINISPLQIALGDISRRGKMIAKGSGSGLIDYIPVMPSGNIKEVKIYAGDDIVKSMKLHLPHVIKIDTEGFEFNVVKGLMQTLNKKQCRLVCCEIHPSKLPRHITPTDVENILKQIGYRYLSRFDRRETYHVMCYR